MPSGPNVHAVVMRSWTKALQTLDNLVAGIPHNIQDPEAFLGLSSWHLYPDIVVVGGDMQHVIQYDDLVAHGGIITLGLHSSTAEGRNGITWSLPLSHLRYYGKPVNSCRTLSPSEARISFVQLLYVSVGCLTRGWTTTSTQTMRFFIALSYTYKEDEKGLPQWLGILCRAATEFQSLHGKELAEAEQLFKFGRRRCGTFFSSDGQELVMAFGLCNPGVWVYNLLDSETRIKWLRDYCKTKAIWSDRPKEAVIRYAPDIGRETKGDNISTVSQAAGHYHVTHVDAGHESAYSSYKSTREYASVYPVRNDTGTWVHRRWVPAFEGHKLPRKELGKDWSNGWRIPGHVSPWTSSVRRMFDLAPQVKEKVDLFDTAGSPSKPLLLGPSITRHVLEWCPPEPKKIKIAGSADNVPNFKLLKAIIKALAEHEGQGLEDVDAATKLPCQLEKALYKQVRSAEAWTRIKRDHPVLDLGGEAPGIRELTGINKDWEALRAEFDKVGCPDKWYLGPVDEVDLEDHKWTAIFGAPEIAEVCIPTSAKTGKRPEYNIDFDWVVAALENNSLEHDKLKKWLEKFWEDQAYTSISNSLEALVTASKVYSAVPSGKIDIDVTLKPLSQAPWRTAFNPTLAECLSCIAMFENANLNINPKDFHNVMAVSNGDSLYIAERLLRDPSTWDETFNHVRHTVGNVGRPGMALLASPRDPTIREPDRKKWRLVQHADFNGKMESNFGSTSLHLHFTGYEFPLQTLEHGTRDTEVSFVETVVQAFDGGSWVADVNALPHPNLAHPLPRGDAPFPEPLKPERRSNTWVVKRLHSCNHSHEQRIAYGDLGLTSVDCWEEILDPPDNSYIVRAKDNWLARLALYSVARQTLKPLILASTKVCWFCVHQASKQLSENDSVIYHDAENNETDKDYESEDASQGDKQDGHSSDEHDSDENDSGAEDDMQVMILC